MAASPRNNLDGRDDHIPPTVTIELTPSRSIESSGPEPGPRVAVVEGSGPHLSAQRNALLRWRVRAVAIVLFGAFGLFFIRNFFVDLQDAVIWVAHILVLFGAGTGITLLSSRRPLTVRQIRALELMIVGLGVSFFVLLQYRRFLDHAQHDDSLSALSLIKSVTMYCMMLMFTYAALVPNTWQRAALVISPIALAMPTTTLALHLLHPSLLEFTVRVASFEVVTDNMLILLIGAVASIYVSHIINALRTEVLEARQLGQYQLRRRLGVGGMGEVYLAEHRLLKRPCALKLIRPENAGDPRALARFEREVHATAKLSHPNTIEIFDYGRTEDGTFYYVMEYLPGMSLAELVKRFGPMPPERVVYLLRQACGALTEAHGIGLVHRDIKPGNLFVAERGSRYDVTKLLDFGLVKPIADPAQVELSRDDTISGSPLYMAPEQATGETPIDPRTDLYALGAVAYYALTGRPPFAGTNPIRVILAHARDDVAPPSQHRPDVPADLEQIVLRCLAKNPSDRYSSAEALEQALAACSVADQWSAADAEQWWRTHGLLNHVLDSK